jgi:putative chitinase
MIHRKLFFDRVRQEMFMRVLSQSQVDGMVALIEEWEASFGDQDLRWLAYIFGTVHHETDRTMQPIEEYNRGGDRLYARCDPETGCAYYGRGFVQLTWRDNYKRAGDELGLDLVHHPEIACDLIPATKIIMYGMIEGWFTGTKLNQYFNAEREDWINARRIVNGLDRANLVAGYAKAYYEALR